MKTNKLYYKDLFQKKCTATVIDVCAKGIVTDQTVAFPESGGQQGDKGVFSIDNNGEIITIPFIDTQKGNGRNIYIKNFPSIQVNTPIYHIIDPDYLRYFNINSKVGIEINVERRSKLTVAHTGIHIVLMAIESINPDFIKEIKGANISEDRARLDFLTEDKFSNEYIVQIQEYVNNISNSDLDIELFTHPDENEAWYWKCNDTIYPCGGTHLPNTKYLGNIKVKRKGVGKNLERVIAEFEYNKIPVDLYH